VLVLVIMDLLFYLNDKIYDLATHNFEKYKCTNVTLLHDTIESMVNEKFDVILFQNSFHCINSKAAHQIVLNKLKEILNDDGIIIIKDPNIDTAEWGSPKLQKDNPAFDIALWNDKKKRLLFAKQAITNNEHFTNILYKQENIYLLVHK
jgi:SAM-dependent methyltransferase